MAVLERSYAGPIYGCHQAGCAWWIGWIEEIPGVNCQERTQSELLDSLREALAEALAFNRDDARSAAGSDYAEVKIAV